MHDLPRDQKFYSGGETGEWHRSPLREVGVYTRFDEREILMPLLLLEHLLRSAELEGKCSSGMSRVGEEIVESDAYGQDRSGIYDAL